MSAGVKSLLTNAQREECKQAHMKYHRTKKRVREERGNKCERCGATDFLTCHHIKPKSEGGSNHPRNLEMLCTKCNLKEHPELRKKSKRQRKLDRILHMMDPPNYMGDLVYLN